MKAVQGIESAAVGQAVDARAGAPFGQAFVARRMLRLPQRLSIRARMRLLLFVLLVPPPALALYGLEMGHLELSSHLVAGFLALLLAAIFPLADAFARLVVLRDLDGINDFCADMKRGRYFRRFDLPAERDDEHETLRLKRNLNWMAHHIDSRETWLRTRLDESDQHKRQFQDLSYRDALTGLHNRRSFDRALADVLDDARRTGAAFGLMLADCDRFKQVNDTFGHPAGDTTLACLGRVLRESVREATDMAFRLGGDEFAVIFRGLAPADAACVCERIRSRFRVEDIHGCTVSLGLVTIYGPGTRDAALEPRDLLERCDAALYEAKNGGGDRLVVSDAARTDG